MSWKTWTFNIVIFLVLNSSLLIPWGFIVHVESSKPTSMYVYAIFMLLWTILGTIGSIFVCQQSDPLPNSQLTTFCKVTKSIIYWLFVMVMIYEVFINLAYANFFPLHNVKHWWLFWPLLRDSFVIYTVSHTFSLMRILESNCDFEDSNINKFILTCQISLDFAIWAIGALNLASMRDETWASPIFPNWEFSRKLFWSAILALRVYLCTISLKIRTCEPENHQNNEQEEPLIENSNFVDLNKIQKLLLVKPNAKLIAVIVTVLYLGVLISSYNSHEKYINSTVNHVTFISICAFWIVWFILGIGSFRNKIRKRSHLNVHKKWIKYLSYIVFAIIALIFSLLYIIYVPNVLGKFCGIMIGFVTFATFSMHLFFKFEHSDEYSAQENKFIENLQIYSIVIGFILMSRLLAIEEVEIEAMHHDDINIIPLEITVPLAIDYFVHVFIHNIYNFYKRMHFLDSFALN